MVVLTESCFYIISKLKEQMSDQRADWDCKVFVGNAIAKIERASVWIGESWLNLNEAKPSKDENKRSTIRWYNSKWQVINYEPKLHKAVWVTTNTKRTDSILLGELEFHKATAAKFT